MDRRIVLLAALSLARRGRGRCAAAAAPSPGRPRPSCSRRSTSASAAFSPDGQHDRLRAAHRRNYRQVLLVVRTPWRALGHARSRALFRPGARWPALFLAGRAAALFLVRPRRPMAASKADLDIWVVDADRGRMGHARPGPRPCELAGERERPGRNAIRPPLFRLLARRAGATSSSPSRGPTASASRARSGRA